LPSAKLAATFCLRKEQPASSPGIEEMVYPPTAAWPTAEARRRLGLADADDDSGDVVVHWRRLPSHDDSDSSSDSEEEEEESREDDSLIEEGGGKSGGNPKADDDDDDDGMATTLARRRGTRLIDIYEKKAEQDEVQRVIAELRRNAAFAGAGAGGATSPSWQHDVVLFHTIYRALQYSIVKGI